jgi:hypothetical protein
MHAATSQGTKPFRRDYPICWSATVWIGFSAATGDEVLPTPVERGFPNLAGTVWFGAEPFPALDFELQLIGADFRQRKVSVPLWFRPSRAEFAVTGQ